MRSSASDAEFDAVVGYLEDIIMAFPHLHWPGRKQNYHHRSTASYTRCFLVSSKKNTFPCYGSDDEFQLLQRNFMDKYYQEFEDTEENKLTYTPIFNEYISLVEKYIEEQLLERIPGFNMAAFTTTLQHHKDEVAGDIFDMLLTFTDFLAFKEMFLDYRAEKEGRGLDLSSGLVVTSLCKSSSTPASQNNLRH
ncbi:ADP-ribosylation factor-like protein 2-binding protein isoform X3 [Choloepus didactylus]|uniref:ADP-ribosylation factor-like protein 2-binding protein isoform X2 n=1 Tax=Choloepus didactylus TaxID=27675 RepID=UPI00189C6EF8|nr:ADP-ribosylation factor-like protein 2-binding protein isoform X2 [Choloepus didactylus]XP_037672415.1 ADP-ribosylation factor-like protein 2-binding protein isoform X3 [Choloepus didactylus]